MSERAKWMNRGSWAFWIAFVSVILWFAYDYGDPQKTVFGAFSFVSVSFTVYALHRGGWGARDDE